MKMRMKLIWEKFFKLRKKENSFLIRIKKRTLMIFEKGFWMFFRVLIVEKCLVKMVKEIPVLNKY